MVQGYLRVVALLAEYPRGHVINLSDVHAALATEMGITQPKTQLQNMKIMVSLGYIELISPGSMTKPPMYRIGPKGRQLLRSETVGSKNEAEEAGAQK